MLLISWHLCTEISNLKARQSNIIQEYLNNNIHYMLHILIILTHFVVDYNRILPRLFTHAIKTSGKIPVKMKIECINAQVVVNAKKGALLFLEETCPHYLLWVIAIRMTLKSYIALIYGLILIKRLELLQEWRPCCMSLRAKTIFYKHDQCLNQ